MAVILDPYVLGTFLVGLLILIVHNLYSLAHFAHYGDSFFGSSAGVKFMLVSKLGFLTKNVGFWLHSGARSSFDVVSRCDRHGREYQLPDVHSLDDHIHAGPFLPDNLPCPGSLLRGVRRAKVVCKCFFIQSDDRATASVRHSRRLCCFLELVAATFSQPTRRGTARTHQSRCTHATLEAIGSMKLAPRLIPSSFPAHRKCSSKLRKRAS